MRQLTFNRFIPSIPSIRGLALVLWLAAATGSVLATGLTPRLLQFQNVQAWVFEAERSSVTVELLPAAALGSGEGAPSQGLTLSSALRHKSIRHHLNKARLLVNAGFSEGQSVAPAGLLMHQGEIISLSEWRKVPAAPTAKCAQARSERLRLSGGLCVAKDGSLKIQRFEDINPSQCRDAVQSGPMLTAPSSGDFCEEAPEPAQRANAARTALCETSDAIKVVVVETPVSLAWLSAFVSAPAASGGLACSRAINLSGAAATGVFLGGPVRTIAGVKLPLQKGNLNTPLASFLMVSDR